MFWAISMCFTCNYYFHWRRKWQPTLVFLPGEFHGQRTLVSYRHGVAKSRTQLSDFTFFVFLFSFRMDWLDLFAFQGTLKNLLQHCSSKASILLCSTFSTVQLSRLCMTTGKNIALVRWTFVGKVMSLLFNMLSRLVIVFLPRGKSVLISWLESQSSVILEPPPDKVCHCFPIYLP